MDSISEFRIAGINYKKTETTIRGRYSIDNDQYERILSAADQHGVREFFVLSTCNRTEIYGKAQDVQQLIDLLCSATTGDATTFGQICYSKSGLAAVTHLFEVSAGLDSQVLGDYEIVGQVKQAVRPAWERGYVGPFLERLVNSALQASKAIKNHTGLSGGTVSVSFAAVQYIRQHSTDPGGMRILVAGAGEIGSNTCRNIIDYLGNKNIVLLNRTYEKAVLLADELGISHAPMGALQEQLALADIVITATTASTPLLHKDNLAPLKPMLIIDMSVPNNVDASVTAHREVTLVNVDELSRIKDETLQKRLAEVPRARGIIDLHITEFREWLDKRKHAPVLHSLRNTLERIGGCGDEQRVRRVVNTTAVKLRDNNQRGCNFIEAINAFMTH